MIFAKLGKNSLRAKLSNAEQKALDAEIKRQLAEYDEKNTAEIDAIALYILYSEFGFRKKRLDRYLESFNRAIKELRDRYEMNPEDDVWLCTRKMKELGYDLEKINKKDEGGN